MNKRPSWVKNYEDLGLPIEWADSTLDKHPEELLQSVKGDLSPLRYIDINILKLEEESLSQFPDPPDGFTFIETVLAIFDFLQSFARNVPEKDNELYQLYENIEDSRKFEIDNDFPDFYQFCRQIQYNRIDQITEYKTLQKTYENYIDAADPEKGSEWLIEHDGVKYAFLVQSEKSEFSLDTDDPAVYGQITEIVSEGEEALELGEFISLSPRDFIEEV